MAKGPTPSLDAEQRNRESGWITLPNTKRPGKAPPLSLAGRDLDKADQAKVRKLWAEWWALPVARMWSTDTDSYGLARLAVLTVKALPGANAATMIEIRQLEDRFGLSPQARRKLYWRIEGVDLPATGAAELGATASKPKPAPKAGGAKDPRLRLVDGGKAS